MRRGPATLPVLGPPVVRFGDVGDGRIENSDDIVCRRGDRDSMLTGAERDLAARDPGVGDYRPRPERAERRDRPALVASRVLRRAGVRQGQAAVSEPGPAPMPGDGPASGHEQGQAVVIHLPYSE